MDNIFIRIAVRRFLELLVSCIVISAFLVMLDVAEILDTDLTLGVGAFIGFVLYAVENIKMLRGCYKDLKDDMVYVVVNMAAYMIFAAVTFAVRLFAPNEVYVWLLVLTKFIRYIGINVGVGASMVFFHAIGFLMIFLAPIGINFTREDPGVGFMEE